jgi:DNA-binding protein H-NS
VEIRRQIEKLEVTVEDLQAAPARRPRKSGSPPVTRQRKPVAVKLRDPDSGATWTGRGRTPRWLAALEAQGRSRDDFLVG